MAAEQGFTPALCILWNHQRQWVSKRPRPGTGVSYFDGCWHRGTNKRRILYIKSWSKPNMGWGLCGLAIRRKTVFCPVMLKRWPKRSGRSQGSQIKEGIVLEFLEKKVPPNWDKRNLNERRMFWASEHNVNNGELVERIKFAPPRFIVNV